MSTRTRPSPRASGVVLAGGASSRFGRDKLLEPVDGEPLLWRPVRALAGVCDEIVLATAPGRRYEVPPNVEVPVRIVHDEAAGAGPIAGVVRAVATVRFPVAVVVGGDMPSLEAADLKRLVDAVHDAKAAAFGQPLPFAVRVAAARAVLGAAPPRSLRALLAALGAVELASPGRGTLRDVDVPDDLPLA